MGFPGGENILAWMSAGALLGVQQVTFWLVAVGIGLVCWKLADVRAAWIGVLWWVLWPSSQVAASTPYYYFWPIPCTVGLAALWLWRGERTRWALPLLVLWGQLRMTAIGPMLVVRGGLGALLITATLVANGHGRTQVWHDLYIGIGTRPNPYGIIHSDRAAVDFAATRGIGFKEPGYEAVLRDEYLRIAAENPGLIARNTVLNFVDAARGWSFWGGRMLWWWVPLVALWGARRPGVYRSLVIVWLAQCATLAAVGKPQEGYLWETAGMFVILGATGLVRAWDDVVGRPSTSTSASPTSTGRTSWK